MISLAVFALVVGAVVLVATVSGDRSSHLLEYDGFD